MKTYSKNQIRRYPIYLKLFKEMLEEGKVVVSSPVIAKELGYSEEQIRKDLQAVCDEPGRPKKGRDLAKLVATLENFLGYRNSTNAVLIGCGHLGWALLNYPNFDNMGLAINAVFEADESKIGASVCGREVYGINELPSLFPKLNASIAIICVPVEAAQEVADLAMDSGAKGIWNFAPTHLNPKEGVVIEDVNLASSLAVLSHRLNEEIK